MYGPARDRRIFPPAMRRGRRWLPAAAASAALVAVGLVTTPATAASGWSPPRPAYRLHDAAAGRTLAILPAGENGLVNATDLARFEATGRRPANSSDQLAMYARLLHADRGLTDRRLHHYFYDESFGIRPGQVTRTERPSGDRDVVIYRDRRDIPHVYAGSLPAMAYGAGYAAAEDRLFLMDVLRHYGAGDLASFVGPSCSIETMDHDQLLAAGYTAAQRQAEIDALPSEYGRLGRQLKSMIDAYVAGINRYITRTRTDPALLPADYAAVGAPPQMWQPSDVVAITSLIGAVATGGGAELKNAQLYDYLRHRLGRKAGRRAFAAFAERNDPAAPTTIHDKTFRYDVPRHVNPALTAIPDHPGRPLSGGPTDTTAHCNLQQNPLQASLTRLLTPHLGASNALLVDSAHSAEGHPIAVFGPELGYYAPQILMSEDLHAPGYDAAGAAFPGANFIVELGRGRGFAWSATTASADQVDLRAERLCHPGGGKPAAEGHYYRFRGHCRPMRHHTFTETAPTKPGGTGAPTVIRHQLYFTVHGVVQGWTSVHHHPVAISRQRSTYGHEPDSLVGLLAWGEPRRTHDAASWMHYAADVGYSFNWFYVDARHIAYYSGGRDPIRDPHADPSLPTWGTGDAEWRGWLSPARHAHAIDPKDGYFTSWNNKPARGFAASDDMFGWGPVQRSQLLDRQLRKQFAAHHGRLTRAQVVTAMEEAATQDLSGVAVIPDLRRVVGRPSSPRVRALLRQLTNWAATGAHRRTAKAGAGQYADAAAVAIWDQAYPQVIRAIFDRLFAAGGIRHFDGLPSAYRALPMEFADAPNGDGTHHGDGYYVGWEGYLVKTLRELAGRRVAQPWPTAVYRRLCGQPSRCRAALRHALLETYEQLVRINGSHDVARWTRDTPDVVEKVSMPVYDQIRSETVGIVGQPAIEWQNRPTFQQVAEFVRRDTR